jgi:hypothetical protein
MGLFLEWNRRAIVGDELSVDERKDPFSGFF